jgi:hypothetical protein
MPTVQIVVQNLKKHEGFPLLISLDVGNTGKDVGYLTFSYLGHPNSADG